MLKKLFTVWTQWQPFGVCDKECGEGLQNYTRTCLGGNNVYCPGNSTETRKCKNHDCPGKEILKYNVILIKNNKCNNIVVMRAIMIGQQAYYM